MGSFGNIHMLHLWPVNALGLTCGGKTDWANLEWRRVDTGSAHILHIPNSEPDILGRNPSPRTELTIEIGWGRAVANN